MRTILLRFKGSVIHRIAWPLVFFTLFSLGVVVLRMFFLSSQNFPELPFHQVLGTVIGMLLVFRTNTGYDRYYAGRRLWSDLATHIRNLAKMVWIGVREDTPTCYHRLEKKSAVNLLVALAYATKNYLRKEYSYDKDPELEQLVRHLPKFWENTTNLEPDVPLRRRPTCVFNKTENMNYNKEGKDEESGDTKKAKERHHKFQLGDRITHAYDSMPPTNIPMELLYYFQSYVLKIESERRFCIDYNRILQFQTECNKLLSTFTKMEQILKTPIPLAYAIHLHQSVFIYLLLLPFSLVEKMGWFTIVAEAAMTFCMLGMLAIGWEIENPFGFDPNDLPLDDYCDVLREEIDRFVRNPFPPSDTWMMSKDNVPFAPVTYRDICDLNSLSTEEFDSIVTRCKPEQEVNQNGKCGQT